MKNTSTVNVAAAAVSFFAVPAAVQPDADFLHPVSRIDVRRAGVSLIDESFGMACCGLTNGSGASGLAVDDGGPAVGFVVGFVVGVVAPVAAAFVVVPAAVGPDPGAGAGDQGDDPTVTGAGPAVVAPVVQAATVVISPAVIRPRTAVRVRISMVLPFCELFTRSSSAGAG